MAYVIRNPQGEIVSAFTMPQPNAVQIAEDDPELLAFRNRPGPSPEDRVRSNLMSDPTFRALLERQAEQEGIPFGQLVSEIAAKARGN